MATLDGFVVCDRNQLRAFVVPGTNRTLAVNKDIAPLLIGWAADWDRLIEPIDTGQLDDWCYACRAIRGSTTWWSKHAYGGAVDLNALKHPMGVPASRSFNSLQVTRLHAMEAKYGVTWGGLWARPDGMHGENRDHKSVAMARAARLQAEPVWPPFERDWAYMAVAHRAPFLFKIWPTSAIYAYCRQVGVESLTELGSHGRVPRPTLREGITRPSSELWPHVLYMQRLLNQQLASLGWSEAWGCGEPDGNFGPRTKRAVVARQRSAELPQTGIWDVLTIGQCGDAWAGW